MFLHVSVISQTRNYKGFKEHFLKAQSFNNHDPDSLIKYATQAYLIASQTKNSDRQLDVLSIIINSEIKSGSLISAMSLCDSAASIAKKNNLLIRQIEIQIYTGAIYHLMGFTSEALELFINAQKQLETTKSDRVLADLYYYKALLCFDIKEIEECHEYLRNSLSLYRNNDSPGDLFSTYMLFSNSFNNIDSIQYYLQLVEDLIHENPNLIFEKVVLRNNQALFNKGMGNYSLSREQYLEVMHISQQNGFNDYLSTIYNNFAYLMMAESKYDSANYYLTQALDIALDIKSLDMESEIYDSYSDYYEKIGDYKNALTYSDLFIEKRDQYRKQQQIQKSQFLSAVFDTEQKEKEILTQDKEILQQENKINRYGIYILAIIAILAVVIGFTVYFIQKFSLAKARMETMEKGKSLDMANAIIHGQDIERKRLAMDLHDGVGARLGALRFMVDGFFKTHRNYQDVSTSIVDIHQNIRNMSHRMSPTELERLGLVDTIVNFVSTINESDRFSVLFETNLDSRLPAKLETNIYFLIYELLNNATRHSKGDTIFVQLLEHGDVISLSVEDNGGGFNYDKNKEGMGLKNIRIRVDYLRGKLNIESNPEDTLFMIEIPVSKHD